MIIEEDKASFTELFASYPLYRKIEVDLRSFRHGTDIVDLTFSYYCPNEKSNQTFRLDLEPEKLINAAKRLELQNFYKLFETYDSKTGKCHLIQQYSATCLHCKEFKVHYLVQMESSGKIPLNTSMDSIIPKLIIKKIGQYPAYEIDSDRDMQIFLNDEDQGNYKKALICLSQNYGIASFAYLRRIVENEIVRIIERIAILDRPESQKIKDLLQSYKSNHNMANLIEEIYDYLPASLKSLGPNPLKLLYTQLSGGIHQFSEEECSEKARSVETVLKFVIKKIREESSEVKAAKEALKLLK
jgi:hypothetical protein